MSQKPSLNEEEKPSPEHIFSSFKDKSLLRVAVLYFTFFYGHQNEHYEAVKQRLWNKNLPACNPNIANELTPSEIAPIIHCSEKKAKEYTALFRILML
jgi:hypothetical protein